MTAEPLLRNPLPADEAHAPAVDRLALLDWSVSHEPSREAYRRCTGDDAGPTLDRYRQWVEANLLGSDEDGPC